MFEEICKYKKPIFKKIQGTIKAIGPCKTRSKDFINKIRNRHNSMISAKN